jgi:hypothetical protein
MSPKQLYALSVSLGDYTAADAEKLVFFAAINDEVSEALALLRASQKSINTAQDER